MGQTGINADLRKLNCGRPGVNDPFFEKLEEVVEEATAVDDRRHNVAHLLGRRHNVAYLLEWRNDVADLSEWRRNVAHLSEWRRNVAQLFRMDVT